MQIKRFIRNVFTRKKWRNSILIEGEKEAMLIARMEGLPEVNRDFDAYPVDMTLPERRTMREAIKKAIAYSKANVYNMFWKEEQTN